MSNKTKKIKVSFNSPVILVFTIICFVAMILKIVTFDKSNDLIFSVYTSSLADPFTYIRFIGHVFGHGSWSHLMGNIMLILVVGPLLEEKYGSNNMLMIIISTAIVTGLVHFMFFPRYQLLGASGVVFALILLSSFTSMKEGSIPMTFILVVFIYIGQQIYEGIFINDNVANFTHIVGGFVGAILGFLMNRGSKIKR